jgi:hypothetical protein
MTMFMDAGAEKLLRELSDAARDLALAFTDAPVEKATEHLIAFCERVRPAFVEALGAEHAARIITRFTDWVIEIEGASTSRQ